MYFITGEVVMNLSEEKGSQTAKAGFQNEKYVAEKFNNWTKDKDAQSWLAIMGYKLHEIEKVTASILSGYKTDINIQIQIKLKSAIDTENLQVKLVSNKKGFNQVDKRWLKHYQELWEFSDDIYKILQYFTGEIQPYKNETRDKRRMFFDEMSKDEQIQILNWFKEHKMLILSDIIRGRGQFSAEWVLVIKKTDNQMSWALKNINEVLQHYSIGPVEFSPKGSLNIGQVKMQRKGGDSGRKTANMLQFKLDPTSIIDNN